MICPLMSAREFKEIKAIGMAPEREPVMVDCPQWNCGFWNGAVGTCGIPAISNDLQNINNSLDNIANLTGR